LLDVQRQRWLRDGQALRGSAEVQLFGQREQVAQMTELHGDMKLISTQPETELDADRSAAHTGAKPVANRD
jgi:hypothetical protein